MTNDFGRQDIRLAVVLNGGVSLAIWISGVTLELHHLAMARRWDETTYGPVLDLMNADARVDVIAGTSAGGLNGAFLALGLTRDRDLTMMRDLWRDHGSLEKLLRDPLRDRRPPSLLMGDDYFLPEVRDALDRMLDQDPPGRSTGDLGDSPVELILTGTLWQGRTSSFTDDMGAAITEMDHDATFHFSLGPGGDAAGEDRSRGGLVDQLAAAARCTSSFPAAFEPHYVGITDWTKVGEGPWASTAGPANFRDPQYLVDGGVLLNKPVRPALEEVYKQTGEFLVRRVLAYVVPHPGESQVPGEAATPAQRPPVPQAREVLLGVLTRLRSTDSVARELTEIRNRNADTQARRRIRDRLAATMTTAADQLAEGAWEGYVEVRIGLAARTAGRLLAAGQERETGRWSERDLISAFQALLQARRADAADPSFIPRGGLGDALQRTEERWDWGATTVQRLGDIAVDLLKRAVWLAPVDSAWQKAIVDARTALAGTLEQTRADRARLDAFWSTAPAGTTSAGQISPRQGDTLGSATNRATLGQWLDQVLRDWDTVRIPEEGAGPRTQWLYRRALDIARHLHGCAGAIAAVAGVPIGADAGPRDRAGPAAVARSRAAIDPGGLEQKRLRALYTYLLAAPAPDGPEEVLRRMLRLDVVQLAFSGASQDVEQEVELVQLSAAHPETLTGVQLHHFGAFYRSSWRMNDWLHGRMDGAAHLVRVLLSTERLRQRAAAMVGGPGDGADGQPAADPVERLLEEIHRCAVSTADPADKDWLEAQWTNVEARCEAFVALLFAPKPTTPQATERALLETCVRAITRSIQTHILRSDLPALADAIRSEGEDCADTSRAWLASYDAGRTANGGGPLPTEQLWSLWAQAEKVGEEKLAGEVGSDTFARTTAHAAAVAASTVGAPAKPKVVATVLAALRGYVLAVWAMVTLLTRRSHFGPRVVELAVAAGAVLLAVAIFVPAMPLAFTLAGVLLLLAGVSAGALLTEEARGVGWRLGLCALVVAIALGAYVYWDWTHNGLSGTIWNLLIKIGIGILVVLVGWYVARARPRGGGRRDRAVGMKAGGDAGAEAGAEAGAAVGEEAGRAAGERAGRAAGEQAGRTAGEQAGQRARWAQRLRKYTSTVSETDIRTKVEEAGEQAGRQDGERAGREAGRAAAREAAEQASHDAAGGPGASGG